MRDNKTETITIRLSANDKKSLQNSAKETNKNLTQFILEQMPINQQTKQA